MAKYFVLAVALCLAAQVFSSPVMKRCHPDNKRCIENPEVVAKRRYPWSENFQGGMAVPEQFKDFINGLQRDVENWLTGITDKIKQESGPDFVAAKNVAKRRYPWRPGPEQVKNAIEELPRDEAIAKVMRIGDFDFGNRYPNRLTGLKDMVIDSVGRKMMRASRPINLRQRNLAEDKSKKTVWETPYRGSQWG